MSRLFSVLRRAVFWSHLAVGVAAGLLILVMCVTGVLLGFERQLVAAIDGTPTVAVPDDAGPLPLDALLTAAGIEPDGVRSVTLLAAPDEPVAVRFRRRDLGTRLLDPYTGATVLPPGDDSGRAFFSALRRWHRWVGAETREGRELMRPITGAANLGFLALVFSGLVLWMPRRWTRSAVRSVTWFRRGLAPKARDFNWHNTIGFWMAIPLALIVATGAFFSYRWPAQWLDRAFGTPAEQEAAALAMRGEAAAPADAAPAAPAEPAEPATIGAATLRAVADAARERHPGWQRLQFSLPATAGEPLTVAVAEGNTYRPDLRTTLVFAAGTARIAEVRDYAALSTSRKLRAWVRYGHTGEVFGVPGQLLATIASAGGALLVLTGLALSVRRFGAWRRRRRPSVGDAPHGGGGDGEAWSGDGRRRGDAASVPSAV